MFKLMLEINNGLSTVEKKLLAKSDTKNELRIFNYKFLFQAQMLKNLEVCKNEIDITTILNLRYYITASNQFSPKFSAECLVSSFQA